MSWPASQIYSLIHSSVDFWFSKLTLLVCTTLNWSSNKVFWHLIRVKYVCTPQQTLQLGWDNWLPVCSELIFLQWCKKTLGCDYRYVMPLLSTENMQKRKKRPVWNTLEHTTSVKYLNSQHRKVNPSGQIWTSRLSFLHPPPSSCSEERVCLSYNTSDTDGAQSWIYCVAKKFSEFYFHIISRVKTSTKRCDAAGCNFSSFEWLEEVWVSWSCLF